MTTADMKERTSQQILTFTPVEEIPGIVNRLKDSFHQKRKTHSLQYRLNQLRNVYFAMRDNLDEICDALYKDFYRAPSETVTLEYGPTMAELVHTMSSLHKWARPEKVEDLPLTMLTNPTYIERVPFGTVLVITPFNYPLFLTISSLAAAISGGNCVILKISELVPHFAQVMTNVLTEALDPDTFAIINGAIPETTALLENQFDKIMYTGSTSVGKIIAKKAAETLTPCLLELGGKSPAFVLDDVNEKDVPTIARRIVWGRFINAGQTCVAIDYVLVSSKVKAKLVDEIVKVIENEFYPSLDAKDPTYTHIIHERAFEILQSIIDSTKGDIICGGQTDSATRFIAPTVIDNATWADSSMQQELFGPVLPILSYDDLEEAVSEVVKRHDTPLALYIFTSNAKLRAKNRQVDLIRTAIRSGGTMVNDSILQVSLTNAPFGGIGQSGQGAYHGFYSYRAFTHERTTIELSLSVDFALKVRYPPLNEKKSKVMQAAQLPFNENVWFGRTGDVAVGGPGLIWSFWNTMAGIGSLVSSFVQSM